MDSNWYTFIFAATLSVLSVLATLSVPTCAGAIPSVSAGRDDHRTNCHSDCASLKDSDKDFKDTVCKLLADDELFLKTPTIALVTFSQSMNISDRRHQSDEARISPPHLHGRQTRFERNLRHTPSTCGRILIAARRVNNEL